MKEKWINLKDQWMAKIQEKWQPLADREKKAVLIGGAFLGVFILYAGIWSPWLNHLEAMREHIHTQQKNLVWMQNVDTQLVQLEKNPKQSEHVTSPIALLSILQKQVDEARLQSNLVQLKQASNETIEIQFQKVSFDKLMQLLIHISKEQSVQIATLNATADTEPGLVNADVVLGI